MATTRRDFSLFVHTMAPTTVSFTMAMVKRRDRNHPLVEKRDDTQHTICSMEEDCKWGGKRSTRQTLQKAKQEGMLRHSPYCFGFRLPCSVVRYSWCLWKLFVLISKGMTRVGNEEEWKVWVLEGAASREVDYGRRIRSGSSLPSWNSVWIPFSMFIQNTKCRDDMEKNGVESQTSTILLDLECPPWK